VSIKNTTGKEKALPGQGFYGETVHGCISEHLTTLLVAACAE